MLIAIKNYEKADFKVFCPCPTFCLVFRFLLDAFATVIDSTLICIIFKTTYTPILLFLWQSSKYHFFRIPFTDKKLVGYYTPSPFSFLPLPPTEAACENSLCLEECKFQNISPFCCLYLKGRINLPLSDFQCSFYHRGNSHFRRFSNSFTFK